MTDTKGGGRRTRIPNRIREIRQARGISMKALGDAVGVHFTTIGMLEQAMAIHPAQRDAYGLLIHMQRAAKRT